MSPLLLLFGGLVLVLPPDREPPALPNRPLTKVECEPLTRLTPDQLRQRLGQPRHISRQILKYRYLEQWTYEEPYRVLVEIDWHGATST